LFVVAVKRLSSLSFAAVYTYMLDGGHYIVYITNDKDQTVLPPHLVGGSSKKKEKG
jgi:hypothetical protein